MPDTYKIDGVVDVSDNPITENKFWRRFIGWVEANGWYFGGGIGPCDDYGNYTDDKEAV